MPPDFHDRVQAVLERLRAAPPGERSALLAAACGGDQRLEEEVRSLWPHYLAMQDFEPHRPVGTRWSLPGTRTCDRLRLEALASLSAQEPRPPFTLDDYTVVEVLGRGGMGVVYRAVHAQMGRSFAIKVLRAGIVSPEDRWRFEFEAQLLRQLRHRGIARLLHTGGFRTDTGECPYYVMDYIDGLPLIDHALVHDLDLRSKLRLLIEVCAAVDYAHARGIVHRDLKPSNILVAGDGQPKVLDFGVARVLAFPGGPWGEESGRFIGTPDYASPEQCRGVAGALTPAADVYALGIISHELLCCTPPPGSAGDKRPDMNRLRQAIQDETGSDAEFLERLTGVLRRALEPSPSRRYPQAGALGAELETLAARLEPSGWLAFKSRIKRLLMSRNRTPAWESCSIERPLSAVLRKRLSLAIESERGRSRLSRE